MERGEEVDENVHIRMEVGTCLTATMCLSAEALSLQEHR